MTTDQLLHQADQLAQDVLFKAAGQVDASAQIPPSHLKALADAGLYGATDSEQLNRIIETLASGCLATTFVWLQHHGLVNRLTHRPQDSFEDGSGLLASLRSGSRRAGIVQAGLLPGPPLLCATRTDQGWALDGFSPWCTGWGMIEDILVAARVENAHAQVVWFVIDAKEQPGLTVEPLRLQAVNATNTVALRFKGLQVPANRALGTDAYGDVGHAAGKGLRPNGSLALGLVARCDILLGELTGARPFAEQRTQLRSAMNSADDSALVALRVASLRLALDAAATVVAASGASSAIAGSTPERLMREATFLMVFGSRPTIKASLQDSLTRS